MEFKPTLSMMSRVAALILVLQSLFEAAVSWTPRPVLVAIHHRRRIHSTTSCIPPAFAPTEHYFSFRALAKTRGSRAALSSVTTTTSSSIPRLTPTDLQQLKVQKYAVIPNFLSKSLQETLRSDVQVLRNVGKFKTAKIGQDSTNTLNTNIRVAETCFLGPSKLQDVPSAAREQLYDIFEALMHDLEESMQAPLDKSLTELLYAYYPEGGFYRRHRDAVGGSASILRKYSLLLYLNDRDWDAAKDGGALRMHFDSGGDELPAGETPNYCDVEPSGGTLVLFQSDVIPHEVLDTVKERVAVVGWYNRPVQMADAVELGGGNGNVLRLGMMAVAAVLVTVGVVGLVS